MHVRKILTYILFILAFVVAISCKQSAKKDGNSTIPEPSNKPWVYWFLTNASISEKGITRELEAMKENGIGGAYLFTIRGETDPPMYEPPMVQFTPEWWKMMKFAVSEADRVGVKLGLHVCDGFTAAGGPWITPELSMQKVVWTDTIIRGGKSFEGALPQPEMVENYYEDIATFALPAPKGSGTSSYKTVPSVSTSSGEDASYLAMKGNTQNFTSREKCWIQYAFEEPFTCRSVTLPSGWNNYQANRLIIETSNDGENFKRHDRLDSYRMGWDDRDVEVTHLVKPVTAKYYRFVFDPEGSEPGAEDLDDAKWRPRLKIAGIELSGEAKIHQFQGKSGAVWRISNPTQPANLPIEECINPEQLVDISEYVSEKGNLSWNVPEGNWVILRMGHTSTGSTNYIGGGALGLECDKLNPEAVKIQFDHWFDSIYNYVGEDLAKNVIEELYNDSWECGSQNWSPVLMNEFRKRRGYDLKSYLPVMAGYPIKSAEYSEQVLYDIRSTIAEALVDNYHGTMKKLAHTKGCRFSTESVAPVFMSDGMLHYKETDAPTGEFWFRSPSHDKPNDILDAISGAHIYGKKVAAAEAGTEIRLDWDEHPAMLKPMFDRNFALGINKIIFHVLVHDPWIGRKPGMALGKVGTFFQPNQTWWKPGKAWVKYIENCQTMLQQGVPVVDVAVFTGEEIPRRAVLPDRLVPVLPGIFGEEIVKREKQRLTNTNQPYHQMPKGVTVQKNIADPENWIDPLNGYAYDSFNKDALLNLATVNNGRIELHGGASYGILVVPGERKMNPQEAMSLKVAEKLLQLVKSGAIVYFHQKPQKILGFDDKRDAFDAVIEELFESGQDTKLSAGLSSHSVGKGQVLTGTYDLKSFEALAIQKDFFALENGELAQKVAWNHRTTGNKEIYFISNQQDKKRALELSFRVQGKEPTIYFPVSGETRKCNYWRIESGRTNIPIKLESNESVFILFEKESAQTEVVNGANVPSLKQHQSIKGKWKVSFDRTHGGPEKPIFFDELVDWTKVNEDSIKFYSGTATYSISFKWDTSTMETVWLDLGTVHNLAEVRLNGQNCGVAWTNPYRLDVSKAIQKGQNNLEIEVTNTWANRLIGDRELPEEKRVTWTNAPYRLEGNPLLKAGLLGPVQLHMELNKN